LKAPSFSSRSNPLELLIARDFIKQQQDERKPALAGQMEEAKQSVKMSKPREMLLKNMQRMKSLADQVPAGQPGIDRFIKGAQSQFKGMTQEMPQLNTYNRFKDIVLGSVVQTIGGETGSRLSDQDIKRMGGAFPNIPYDSEDQRNLGWSVFLDTVNDVASQYGAKTISPEEFFNPQQLESTSQIAGSPLSRSPIPGMPGYQQPQQMQQMQPQGSGEDPKTAFLKRKGLM